MSVDPQPTHVDVLVVGSGIPALAAALECAKVGLKVHVIETEFRDDFAGAPVFDIDGLIAELIVEVGTSLSDPSQKHLAAVQTRTGQVWVETAPNTFARTPADGLYGIPASPLSHDAVKALGVTGALRAYLDRIKPILTIGKEQFFGRLVRSRLGRKVLEAFVDPLVRHRYGVAPSHVEVAVLAPGLNETMTRVGSLSGAVLAYQERAEHYEQRVEPSRGWSALRSSLLERIEAYNGTHAIRSEDVFVERHETPETPHGAMAWRATTEDGEFRASALIIDEDDWSHVRTPAPLDPVEPGRQLRVTVRTNVQRPHWWRDDFDAPVIRVATVPDLGVWTSEVQQREDGFVAEVRGPTSTRADVPESALPEVFARFELSATDPETLRSSVSAAPLTAEQSVHDLTEHRAGLEEIEPSLIISPTFAQDASLAGAIQYATSRAVTIRRKLAGIA